MAYLLDRIFLRRTGSHFAEKYFGWTRGLRNRKIHKLVVKP
jgi:hypothetical protein